tara:strand:- start:282 stop:1415 length:1134 start_codon:yes stop_codon:yes gene_type:complete
MSTNELSLLSDYLIPTTKVGGKVNPLSGLLNEVVNPPALNQPDPSLLTGPKRQENFANWFKQSKAVNERGVPLTLYHGTTHDFKEFKPELGSKSGFMGASIYLSDSPDDASINYGSKGEDLKNRVNSHANFIADRIMFEPDGYKGVKADPDMTPADAEYLGKKIAKKELIGPAERTIPVNASLQNPIYLSKNPESKKQYINFRKIFDIDDPPKEQDYEEYSEYEEALDEWYETENERMLLKIKDKLEDAYFESEDNADRNFDKFEETAIQDLFTEIMDGGGEVTPEQIDHIIRKNSIWSDSQNEGNIIKEFFKSLGYDGIIMDAQTYFPRMKYTEGTKHYILFDPTKVKSLFNKGTYDPNDPDITAKRQPRKSLLEA